MAIRTPAHPPRPAAKDEARISWRAGHPASPWPSWYADVTPNRFAYVGPMAVAARVPGVPGRKTGSVHASAGGRAETMQVHRKRHRRGRDFELHHMISSDGTLVRIRELTTVTKLADACFADCFFATTIRRSPGRRRRPRASAPGSATAEPTAASCSPTSMRCGTCSARRRRADRSRRWPTSRRARCRQLSRRDPQTLANADAAATNESDRAE